MLARARGSSAAASSATDAPQPESAPRARADREADRRREDRRRRLAELHRVVSADGSARDARRRRAALAREHAHAAADARRAPELAAPALGLRPRTSARPRSGSSATSTSDGYLRDEPRGDRAPGRACPLEPSRQALARVQELRSGRRRARATCASVCCSRCDALGIDDPLVRRIVDEALDAAAEARLPRHRAQLGVTIEEVAVASRVIGRLEPRPGRAVRRRRPRLHHRPTSTCTRSATSSTSC